MLPARATILNQTFWLPLFVFFASFSMVLLTHIGEGQSIFESLTADFTNRQAAVSVLGQPDFTTITAGAGAAKFNRPENAVVDPVSKKVFVVEQNNNRVVRFTSAAAMTNGAAAEAVFGQPDLTTTTSGITQSKMSNPADVSVDAAGRLWVADYNNHRVLRFDHAASKGSGGNADAVLGQADFVTRTFGAGANKMYAPASVFADSSGRLWVADINNNRVLKFDNAAAKANRANADAVLGQPDFTTVAGGAGANRMNNPAGVAYDTGGHLYVGDANNNRVLRFDAAASKANGANADAVFGQTDFTTTTGATTQSKMNLPQGVATDASGRLYVADLNNNRVLIFNNAGTAANGASASFVLGQPDFTTGTANTGGVSAASMNNPISMFFDEALNNLFVADYSNNRVLRFAVSAPTAASVTIGGRVSTGRKITPRARVELIDAAGTVRYAYTNNFGYYRFTNVGAGETYILTVSMKNYVFPPQVIFANEDINNLNFAGY